MMLLSSLSDSGNEQELKQEKDPPGCILAGQVRKEAGKTKHILPARPPDFFLANWFGVEFL
jgi:hypothetical protein